MGNQAAIRLRLCALISDYGSTIAHISRATHIERTQLNRFKLGKLILEPDQAKRLDNFLTERGYSDDLKAFTAVVQGNFID